MAKDNILVKSTKKAVDNPTTTLYLIGGIFGLVAIYKMYNVLFPPKDKQETASTNFNSTALQDATMSDQEIYSVIDLFIDYINPTFFGTKAQKIIDLITQIGIPNFAKVNHLFGKKMYNGILSEIVLGNNVVDSTFFQKFDLKNILFMEFENESDIHKAQLKNIYDSLINYGK